MNKARPLPKRLINELLPAIGTELPSDLKTKQIPSKLCDLLNQDKKSPLHRLIKRESTTTSAKNGQVKAVIQDSALITVMEESIHQYGALALFKNAANSGSDIEEMYRVMRIYWGAVKEVFPEAWGKKPQESRLMHSAGIRAMGKLMDRIVPRVNDAQDMQGAIKGRITKKLHPIAVGPTEPGRA